LLLDDSMPSGNFRFPAFRESATMISVDNFWISENACGVCCQTVHTTKTTTHRKSVVRRWRQLTVALSLMTSSQANGRRNCGRYSLGDRSSNSNRHSSSVDTCPASTGIVWRPGSSWARRRWKSGSRIVVTSGSARRQRRPAKHNAYRAHLFTITRCATAEWRQDNRGKMLR